MATVLVTGATGFIGRRLVPALLDAGHDVRAMTRRPETYDGPGDAVGADVMDPDSLAPALDGADVAIYLVHSLDDPDFERKDAEAARNFSAAAAEAGLRQIVYMGGLGDDDQDLSAHLRSRREVEGLLGTDGVPVTVLRAAIVVGHGGISWEITRQLVKNLPAMVVPRWVSTRTQPIALDDVVRYLAGVVDHPDALGRVFEIGGTEQLTYLEMMQVAARVDERPAHPDRRGPAADPAAVVVLAGARHRRRRHHRSQPHRLDVLRGRRHRHLDPRGRAGRAAVLPRVRTPGAGRSGPRPSGEEQG